MSTRARIAIVVKDEDLNKTFKANPELLHAPLNEGENKGLVELHETTVEHKVLSIYHHWDGYIEGVGETLLSKYDTYEKVLNLMLFGDASTINSDTSVTFYNAWRGDGEPWECVKPAQSDDIPELVKTFMSSDQEYLYIYIPDSKGNYDWYYIEAYGDDKGQLKHLRSELNGEVNLEVPPVILGNEVVERTEATVEAVEQIHVLVCQVGESMTVEAVSSDMDKLKVLMKEKITEHLEDIYGAEDELDPDCDDYELGLYESVKELAGTYWSDEDDEMPVQYYIVDADLI